MHRAMVDYGDILQARGRIGGTFPVTPAVRALALALEERLGAPRWHFPAHLY